jgi:hypothetical protein
MDPEAEALRRALIAADLDPTGLDLVTLAGIWAETEKKIAGHRQDPGFATATPAFKPPTDPP